MAAAVMDPSARATTAGVAFLPLAVMITLGTRVGGHLLSRTAPRVVAAGGLAVSAGAALLLSTASASAGFAANVLPGMLLLGIGVGVVFVAVSVTAMTGIPAQHAGTASGFLMTGHEIGAALGVAVLSAVAAASGDLTSAPGAASGYSAGFVATAVLVAALAVAAFVTLPAVRGSSPAGGLHLH